MANDKRRYVRTTLSEEQTLWIERRFGLSADANKADAVRSLIDNAMSAEQVPNIAPSPEAPTLTAVTCAMNGTDDLLRTILASVELLTLKYMADHPERPLSRDFEATMKARWRSYTDEKRPEHIRGNMNVAP